MEAWIQGQKVESTLLKPVVINLKMEHIVQRPRRALERLDDIEAESLIEYIERFGACHRLRPSGRAVGRIGWCPWVRRWLHGVECESCIHSGERH